MKLSDIWAIPQFHHPDKNTKSNIPVNLTLSSRIDRIHHRSLTDENHRWAIDLGQAVWIYDSEEDRDRDYRMLMEKITKT